MISEEKYQNAALLIGCDAATVKAVSLVESSGKGFQKDGKPKILFEGHIFWKQLKKAGRDPEALQAGNEDILYPVWNANRVRPLYKMDQYARLNKARTIDAACADASASWGLFQVMGFNYKACGCQTAEEFITAQGDEFRQLECFCNYIRNRHLDVNLAHCDWAGFARAYNGPDYTRNQYDSKLKKAYDKFNAA
jgi:hypothetical protein